MIGGKLPDSVKLCGVNVKINPDFRLMIRLEVGVIDNDEKALDKIINRFFESGIPTAATSDEIINALVEFYRGGNVEESATDNPDDEETESPDRPYSFKHDSDYIFAAFMQVYGIDLYSVNLHWYKFRALLNSLPAECRFMQIVKYRTVEITPDMPQSEQDFYRRMKRQYALPLSADEQERMDELTARLMNGGDLSGLI